MADRLNGYRILILETREEAQFSRLLIEQGADFIFIDRDIFANLDQRAVRETRVLETYVAGHRVWSRENAASATAR